MSWLNFNKHNRRINFVCRPIVHIGAVLLGLLLAMIPAQAQDLPACFERPTFRDPPWIDGKRYCLETAVRDPDGGDLAFTALAAAPDGTLYAARPLHGQVLAITDSDGDGLPDASRVVADGLTLPNGLAYHEGALYIAGGAHLYRLVGDELEMLVDDVPVGPGGWSGSLIVGPDDRLYLSIGASCDFCAPARPEHGAILSFALDGSDPARVATGLRQGGDMAFIHHDLWVTDSARSGLADAPDLDELNRVRWGADFGWPACVGAGNLPDEAAPDADCDAATAPALTFPTGSTPLGMAAYTADTLPDLDGTLLVILNGSRHQVDLRGYALAVVRFESAGDPAGYDILIPFEAVTPARVGYSLAEMNYRTSGFWPNRPLDVAVSPEGWLYISVSGGEILAVRPR